MQTRGLPKQGSGGPFSNASPSVDESPDLVVYVYSHHERSTLERQRHLYGGTLQLDRFIERLLDVHAVLREVAVMPTQSTSLKHVARWLGFAWREPDASGLASLVWWRDCQRAPAANSALRERLLRYNEDDTRATQAVVDWLSRSPPGPRSEEGEAR